MHKAKYLRQYSANARKSQLAGRVMRTATAAVMAGLLAFPGTAFAAESINVGGDNYTEAASGAGAYGGSWSWDGADDMVLDNYDGTRIDSSGGSLNIELVGDNRIVADADHYAINSAPSGIVAVGGEGDSELKITGDGNLTVVGEPGHANNNDDGYAWAATGIRGYRCDVVIDGADVNIDYSNSDLEYIEGGIQGISTYGPGDIRIINGSNVTVNCPNTGAVPGGGIYAGNLNKSGQLIITDSTVNAVSGTGVGVGGSHGVTIENSVVNAQGIDHAIYSWDSLSVTNSDIYAETIGLSASSDEIAAEAEAGASQGAAIAAKGGITLRDVNLYGATVAVDEDGTYYVVNADGTTGSVSMKHTGAASKYVNGVGNTGGSGGSSSGSGGSGSGGSSSGGSASGSTADGSVRAASTGGGILQMVADALSRTLDPTSFGPVTGAVLAAAAALTASASMRKRNGLRAE